MKKSTIGVLVVVIIAVVGGVTWWLMSGNKSPATQTPANQTVSNSSDLKDMTASQKVDVTIHDLSYSPAAIKVKKGTTVTWTNQDSVGHNVIADDAPDNGGIPTTHELLGRGQTQSIAFERVGTFSYHCGAHSFMHGSVQVVD
jgi:amicyanin